MGKATILVIDDDRELRDSLQLLLQKDGFDVATQSGARDTETYLQNNDVDAVLCDVRMPGVTGLELLERLGPDPSVPLVLMSAHGDIAMAVEAVHNGAFTFLEKPFDPRQLLGVLARASEHGQLRKSEQRLRERLNELGSLDRILIGESPAVMKVRNDIADIAESPANVLIAGETGTGKELVARAIHDLSANSAGRFVDVNCAIASDGAFEQTLFGAKNGQTGLLLGADSGTLFLDEIGTMPLVFQPKLLRAIESRQFYAVGSDEPTKSDFRLIAASGTDLGEMVAEGNFRQDLLFRLNTIVLELPPLRTRGEDIALLYTHFLNHFSSVYGIEAPSSTAEDLSTVLAYEWPGNVRELRNVCERQLLLSQRERASVSDAIRFGKEFSGMPETLREAVATFERQLISRALIKNAGRMDDVADELGIGRRTLNEKIVKLGIDKDTVLAP
ncbi:MAG: sigma-54 dependent transcriptional regulator [Pseudomonadota bacterium]